MSRLGELIRTLCPDGVEYKRLGDILYKTSTGLNPRSNFRLNTEDAKNMYVTVKEITKGKIVFSEKTDKINDEAVRIIQNRSNLEKGDVLLSGIGTIGKVALVDIPTDNWNCSESVFILKPKHDTINAKFLKYVLEADYVQNYFDKTASGSTLRGIRQKDLVALEIPVPPMEVQEEIVRILDKFTALEAELEAELEARKKQYEHYRDTLLEFTPPVDENVTFRTIGEIGKVCMCKRIMKNETTKIGDVPFYKIGTFGKEPDAYISYDLYKRYKERFSYPKKGDVLISAAGTIGRTVIYDGELAYFQDSNIVWVDNDETLVTNKFLFYIYQKIEWQIEGSTIKRLYNDNLMKIKIPIPPIEEQERIVGILDKFEAFCTDLCEGLPAEIEARRRQYEHYRDRLLSFRRRKNI